MSEQNFDLATTPRIFLTDEFSSKKKAIEVISSVLAEQCDFSITDIIEALMNRERLGSTAIGKGIAIPHGRLSGLERAMGVLIITKVGVDMQAPDQQPVDIFFGLIIPEECCDQHLTLLKEIASIATLSDALELFRSEQKQPAVIYQWIANNNPQLGEILQ